MSVRIVTARGGKGFEYDIRLVWPEGGRLRERGKCTPTGRDDAKRWATARERAILAAGKAAYVPLAQAARGIHKGVPTVAEFWPVVLSGWYLAQRKKASTVDAAERIFERRIRDRFGAMRLDELTDEGIAALKGSMADKAPGTVNNVLSVLSRILKFAIKLRKIKSMPCEIGILKVPEKERPWYEPSTYARLIEGARKTGNNELLIVLLGGSAGLRSGEIQALRWTDVDLERRQLTISRAIWHGIEDTPKGWRSRVVPLTEGLMAALRAQRSRTGLLERVVSDGRGNQLNADIMRAAMARVQKRAGMEQDGKIHILRHTFCSHLAISNVPAKAIQELAGHADLKTTLRYMHLAPGNRQAAVHALDKLMAEATAPTTTGKAVA
ncbi:Integrase [Labilithrix luteola]|uniref:Integrase n=1 Tax=Labilithrix luteola TaxID=1391654 RepID=A0A0K1PJX9_9BACT|nr:site-specific integrase [Labilithrix luteola]AKU93351.1 hypothetical protein AKJ09_00015 [Labilithrix luteola]AKU93419.1 Integrase [Labilithrix luteola]